MTNRCVSLLICYIIACSIVSVAENRHPNIIGTVTAIGKPMVGVQVSDGKEITLTDNNGRYELTSDKREGVVFITTPAGFVAESTDNLRPLFWYETTKGKEAIDTIDFRLKPEDQSKFAIIFTTDTHLTNDSTKDDLKTYENLVMPRIRDIASEYDKHGTVYSFNLGDISHELYWYDLNMPLDKVVEYIVETGYPTLMYSISGNHDNDGAITGPDTDFNAAWLYRKTLGPAQYAINIGNTHWVMLDNIIYKNNPGKGKKAKGINGDRSYDVGFTSEQLAWLAKDLETVSDSTDVYICCHAPLLYPKYESGILLSDASQMDQLDSLLSRWPKVSIFSGHAHRNLHQTNPSYPRFEQYVLGATSGSMWTTSKSYQTLGEDGSAAGVWVGDFTDFTHPQYHYHTYTTGDPMLRVYDLNEVGRYYRTNADVQNQLKLYPNRVNYGNPEFTDMIMVNFWCDREDLTLEIIENNQLLPVRKDLNLEDPLFNISHYVPITNRTGKYQKSHDNIKNHHMYIAKTSHPHTPVVVFVKAHDGKILYHEKIIRPKKFDKHAK